MILLIASILGSAAFEPIGLWYLAPVGFAIYFRKLTKTHRPVIGSFLFGAVLNAIVLHWSSKYVGAIPWIFLSLLQAIFYIPIGLIYRKTKSLRWTIFALLLAEEIRTRFPFGGFGWTRIAFSQVQSPFLPLVSYGGVALLSFVTLLIALSLARFKAKSLLLTLIAILVVGLLPLNQSGSEKISLAAIQGNTPSVGLEFNNRAKAVFDLHLQTTRKFVNRKYDAIIWPENAIDIDPRNYPEVADQITTLVSELKTPLISGVVLNRNGSPANASVLYSPEGIEKSIYIKRYLTPFGEYMPLRPLAEFISPYAKSVVDFQPGRKFATHEIAGNKLAPIICYEILSDEIVREAAKNSGALLVQTNSATFANTAESAQQLAITRIRAAEHARQILSVSTVGISAFIDHNGVVQMQSRENISTILTGDVFFSDKQTWADRLGGVAPLITLLLALALALSKRRVGLR